MQGIIREESSIVSGVEMPLRDPDSAMSMTRLNYGLGPKRQRGMKGLIPEGGVKNHGMRRLQDVLLDVVTGGDHPNPPLVHFVSHKSKGGYDQPAHIEVQVIKSNLELYLSGGVDVCCTFRCRRRSRCGRLDRFHTRGRP